MIMEISLALRFLKHQKKWDSQMVLFMKLHDFISNIYKKSGFHFEVIP
jgi:hypothetical protein